VISLDCGANTHFAARHLMLRSDQRLTETGMMASMAPGLSFAIAAQLAYPGRQSVAVAGDGGFAMLMAEMTTAVAHNLPVKVIILKNNSLAEASHPDCRATRKLMVPRIVGGTDLMAALGQSIAEVEAEDKAKSKAKAPAAANANTAPKAKKPVKRNPNQREMLLPIGETGAGKAAAKEEPKKPAKAPAKTTTTRKAS
jgi:hypothetical protein